MGVTSVPTEHTHPTQIATHVRNHRHIENRPHRIRDLTYTEDHSRIRTTNTPRIIATFHNLTISTPRHHDWDNIAKDLRHTSRNPTQPLTLLGIPT